MSAINEFIDEMKAGFERNPGYSQGELTIGLIYKVGLDLATAVKKDLEELQYTMPTYHYSELDIKEDDGGIAQPIEAKTNKPCPVCGSLEPIHTHSGELK